MTDEEFTALFVPEDREFVAGWMDRTRAARIEESEREMAEKKTARPGPDVRGQCPMGCGETLFLGNGGFVTCAGTECPDPEAVANMLEVPPELGHIVLFSEDDTFTIQHPLLERVQGSLFDCPLHAHLTSLYGPPVGPGSYRVTPDASQVQGWKFAEIDENGMETGNG